MKKNYYFLCLCFLFFASPNSVWAQDQNTSDSTGLPGDNFSLKGALALFEKAGSPENFEQLINTESNNVNNLDLNDDGEIDYVQVIDNYEKDAHAFILRVAVSETESQDIAVIELEKTGEKSAMVQIVGDKDIYGEEVIVEPDNGSSDETFLENNSLMASHGPNATGYVTAAPVVFNVWVWPIVHFVFAPAYVVYRSPWGWRHHPYWWKPWRPWGWRPFYMAKARYRQPFIIVSTHRVTRAHMIYVPVRRQSVYVGRRYAAPLNNYRVTRTKTTVTTGRGNTYTKTRTTVSGKKGRVKAYKTTVRKRRHW